MTEKTVYVLIGINVWQEKYIVAVFESHSDAVEYAGRWKVPSWHIYEAPLH